MLGVVMRLIGVCTALFGIGVKGAGLIELSGE